MDSYDFFITASLIQSRTSKFYAEIESLDNIFEIRQRLLNYLKYVNNLCQLNKKEGNIYEIISTLLKSCQDLHSLLSRVENLYDVDYHVILLESGKINAELENRMSTFYKYIKFLIQILENQKQLGIETELQ